MFANRTSRGRFGAGTSRAPARPGFSLFELIIIIAIIAVLSAVAMPRYARSMDRYRADAAANRIVADLAYARREAQASSAAVTVMFGVAPDAYAVLGVDGLDGQPGPYTVELGAAPYSTTLLSAVLDDPVDVADDLQTVIFDGYGIPDSGGAVTIQAGSQARTIVLDADTGKAAVQ